MSQNALSPENDLRMPDLSRSSSLQEQEEQCRGIVEHTHALIFTHDLEGRLLAVNRQVSSLFGAEAASLRRRRLRELLPPSQRLHWEGYLAEIRERGRSTGLVTIVRTDGSKRVLEYHNTLWAETGSEPLVHGFALDVTERLEAEMALRQSELRYRRLFEASPLPMWLYDAEDSRILDVNQAAVEHYGYTREEFLRMTIGDVRPSEELPRFQKNFREPKPERWHAGIWTHRRKDGTAIQVDVFTHEVALRGRRRRIALLHDVTDRLRLEEQFRQAQKMEAVGRLAAGVAHDFNNLLTVVNGYADLLLASLPEDDPHREHVEEIRKAADRGTNLTRQLSIFSRKQVAETRVLSLSEVVGGAEKMLRRLIGEDVRLDLKLEDEECRVKADPGQIEQVLMNLVVNARDAMPTGGSLTIEVACVDAGGSCRVYAENVEPGRYAVLAVADTGCGMEESIVSRIFDPFFTTKEAGKGTGLGLATVFGIVKQAGGYVSVATKPREGSTFRIFLPCVEEQTTKTDETGNVAPAPGNEKVLVVEDDPALREIAGEILSSDGYQVLLASSGEEALEILGRHPARIDLLLTDVVMPGIDGPLLAARALLARPDLRVVFMSGYLDGRLTLDGDLASGSLFLPKPFSQTSLTQAIRSALGAPPRAASGSLAGAEGDSAPS